MSTYIALAMLVVEVGLLWLVWRELRQNWR